MYHSAFLFKFVLACTFVLGLLNFQISHAQADLEVSLLFSEDLCGADVNHQLKFLITNVSDNFTANFVEYSLNVNGEIADNDFLGIINPVPSNMVDPSNERIVYLSVDLELGVSDLIFQIDNFNDFDSDPTPENNSISFSLDIQESCSNERPSITAFPYQELVCEEEALVNDPYTLTLISEHDPDLYDIYFLKVVQTDSILEMNQTGVFAAVDESTVFKAISVKTSENVEIEVGMRIRDIGGCCTKVSEGAFMYPLQFRTDDWEISYSCIDDNFMEISIIFLPGFSFSEFTPFDLKLEGSLADLLGVNHYSTDLKSLVVPAVEGSFELIASGDHKGCGIPFTIAFTNCQDALSGTYTVGGATADFEDLQEVNTAFNNFGQKGTVRLEMNPGIYNTGLNPNPAFPAAIAYTIEIVGPDWIGENNPLVEIHTEETAMSFYQSLHLENLIVFCDGEPAVSITKSIEYLNIENCRFHQIDPEGQILENRENPSNTGNLIQCNIENCQFFGGSIQVSLRLSEAKIKRSNFEGFSQTGIYLDGNLEMSECIVRTEEAAQNGLQLNDVPNSILSNVHVSGKMENGIQLTSMGCGWDFDIVYCLGKLTMTTSTISVPGVPVKTENLYDVRVYNSNLLSREGSICVEASSVNSHLIIENSILATYGVDGVEGNNFSWTSVPDNFFEGIGVGELTVISSNQYSLGAADSSTAFNCNPMFTSELDLHVNNPLIFDAGTADSYWTQLWDIDGEVRDETPTIGADERNDFTAEVIDIELVGLSGIPDQLFSGEQELVLLISNNGDLPITSFEGVIESSWGFDVISFSLSDVNIEPGEVQEVLVHVFDFNFTGQIGFTIVISQPNGLTDGYPPNNSLDFSWLISENAGGSVEIVSMVAPGTTVEPGDVPFEITITNNGTSTVTELEIEWWIDWLEQDLIQVDSILLEPGQTITIELDSAALYCIGDYTATFYIDSVNDLGNAEEDSNPASFDFTVASLGEEVDVVAELFLSPASEIGASVQNVRVQFRNDGPTFLDYVELHWSVNGANQEVRYLNSQNLLSGESTSFDLGEFDFDEVGNYDIVFQCLAPNGQVDSEPSNNTIQTTITVLNSEDYPCPNFWDSIHTCDDDNETYTYVLSLPDPIDGPFLITDSNNGVELTVSVLPVELGPFSTEIFPSITIVNISFPECISTIEYDPLSALCCTSTTWYIDVDDDDLGDPENTVQACEQPEGYVANGLDDNDNCPAETDECGVCQGPGILDGFCDCEGTPEGMWYVDNDLDGLGDPNISVSSCEAPNGYVGNADDVDDNCAGELDECGVCDGVGIPDGICDCEGNVETTWYVDFDMDGLGDPNSEGIGPNCDGQPDGYVDNASDDNDNMPSGIDGKDELGISIYPNPTTGVSTLLFSPQTSEMQLELHELSGKTVLREKLESGVSELEISVDGLAPGMYLLKLQSSQSGKVYLEKLIVN